ncbi:DegT/DnrJ/EryC1/StrS family aminotransferase [Candidatus Collierbacteria bacterium]|nr:DegT/DnrJ/EryC1/StrS family aminotransferase [Candidatus Collierbacteria bacterium]
MRIGISKSHISNDEIKRVIQTLRSGQISQGTEVEKFETELANYLKTKEVVVVNSGTSALHLALLAAGIGKGDEVIVPAFSFIATANAVLYCGAKPVFADVELDNFLISPKTIAPLVNRKTKAVIMVSLYGNPQGTRGMFDFCERNKLFLIEDAAQSLGAESGKKKIGTFGIGCFSFYATKNITTGEGGAIALDDGETAKRIRSWRNHGNSGGYYQYDKLGFNYRMTDIQAAIGRGQLRRIRSIIEARKIRARKYLTGITNSEIILPIEEKGHVWHQFTLRSKKREIYMRKLRNSGIESKIYYPIPIYHQKVYQELGYQKLKLTNTEILCREVFSIPVHPGVSLTDVGKICRLIR